MEEIIENIIAYGLTFLLIALIIIIYLRRNAAKTKLNEEKILKAKESGFHEPVSLHPVVDPESCIGSGACIAACPEHDILGLVNG